jgi:hypothetical protein
MAANGPSAVKEPVIGEIDADLCERARPAIGWRSSVMVLFHLAG